MDATTRAAIERIVVDARVPGCAIALTDAATTRARLLVGDAVLEPRRPVSAATVFHLFSGTKLYTAAALMVLAQDGRLDLDAPVTTYLPELRLRHPVTPRRLASHSAGLRDTLRAFLAVHPEGAAGPDATAALARYRLDHGRPPGGAARYGNVNYALLGALIERVAGAPYVDFVRAAVLEPLGAALSFAYTPAQRDEAATGYVPRWSPMRLALRLALPDVGRWIYAGRAGGFVGLRRFNLDTAAIGGLLGAIDGFLPLLREMLAEEGAVLSAASRRAMLTVQAEGAAGIVSRAGVGIGWKRGLADGVTFWNHEGGGPGFCSETRVYPAAGIGVVVLMNRSQSVGLSRVCHRICERLRVELG